MTEDELLQLVKQAEREQWEELDLSGLGLTEVSDAIGRLHQLKVLNLGYNQETRRRNYLTALPEASSALTNLQSLDLGFNDLSTLPEWLRRLTNLQLLDLGFNNLNSLPEWLGELTNLQSLDLSSNNLSTLPEWLRGLTNLQSLDLGFNNLSTLPEWLGGLTDLQSLDLSSNNLSSLPEWLGGLTNLQSLDLSSNNFSSLPEWLGELTNLQSLHLSSTNLSTLPDWLRGLTNLQSLHLSRNNLSTLPEWLRRLTNLRSLHLSSTNLSTLPEWLGELTNLESLHLSSNDLNTLPEWLGRMTNLQSLDLGFNNLSTLPEWLGRMTNLQSLRLSRNNISVIPEWLGELNKLQLLDLRSTKLSTLPAFVVNLPQLRWLYIHGNPISEPLPEILGDALTSLIAPVDIPAVRRYYAQLQEVGTAAFYEAKLLIIGEGGAGKTSFAHKLVSPHYQLTPVEESTEGIDILRWQFSLPDGVSESGEPYQVNIWDFGGQEIYFATHQFFLTKRSVYVLVADTRRQHTDFYTWLQMQETFGGDSPVILLKNRNRQHGNRFTIENLPQLRERFANLGQVFELDLSHVPEEEAWPLLLRELQHRFLGLEHVGKPRPRTWVEVRQALQADERDTISKQQFLEICRQHRISREDDALQLSDYLHHLGDILHFQDDPMLDDVVILKPTWGLDAIYRVLDNEAIVDNWGRFTRHDLRALWHEPRYAGRHHQLLRLMQNFQLCYPLPDIPDTFIAPQLLRPDVPDYAWESANNLQLRYRYPTFMPRGILSRAIVKLHQQIEEQTFVWRAGVILNDGYARAELLELRGENEIRIRIAGSNKRDLLMEIVRALDDLHRGFAGLRYEKLIPCNCSTCRTLSDPHFYDLEHLRQRLANRKETIECSKPPYEDVAIRSLLDDVVLPAERRGIDRDVIYNFFGDFVARGGKHMGEEINVGNIEGSSGVAIGRAAQSAVTTTTTK